MTIDELVEKLKKLRDDGLEQSKNAERKFEQGYYSGIHDAYKFALFLAEMVKK